jgi:FemAB-related protein (PEP-CTERM system-associated)
VASEIQIKQLDADSNHRWDAYVEQAPEATFFHKSGWQTVLERAFGHTSHYFYAEQDGNIVGVLPLAEVKSWLFGHALISTPFCVYGGPVGDSQTVIDGLIDAACQLADTLRVDHLELRNQKRLRENWPCKDLYFTFRRSLSDNEEENLKAIPRKQRAVVRKALELEMDSSFDEDIGPFYQAYSASVRNLGTPVFSKKYFRILKQVFQEHCDVLSVRKDGQMVSSVMSFYFRDQVLPYYGGGSILARSLKGNDLMYWRLMCSASERGYRVFDYGRSKAGTGAFSFKKNWGFEPQALHYEYYLVTAKDMPELNPTNPKYALMIKCWKKLPLKISQWLGPFLSKYLG